MDAAEVSLSRLTRAARCEEREVGSGMHGTGPSGHRFLRPGSFLGLAACGIGLVTAIVSSGCGRSSQSESARAPAARQQLGRVLREEAKKAVPKTPPGFEIEGLGGNEFTVDDADGKRILEARVERVVGKVQPGKGLDGPVRLQKAKCRLFRQGKPQYDLESPEVVWDGKQLFAERSGEAVSADKATQITARRVTWTAESGLLELEQGKVVGLRQGRVHFTAAAPRAQIVNRVAVMPAGAEAHNETGQSLSANHVRWGLDTGKLDAAGNVVLIEPGTRVSGARLVADTRLRRGKLTGGGRIVSQGGLRTGAGG